MAVPEILEGDTLDLEGEELRVIGPGHTDTANSTALHVPSIGLVASGDAVYNNTHPYLAECDEKARGEWLELLKADVVREAYLRKDKPGVVVVLEASTAKAAETALSQLPFYRHGLIRFDLIPVGPFTNFERLFS